MFVTQKDINRSIKVVHKLMMQDRQNCPINELPVSLYNCVWSFSLGVDQMSSTTGVKTQRGFDHKSDMPRGHKPLRPLSSRSLYSCCEVRLSSVQKTQGVLRHSLLALKMFWCLHSDVHYVLPDRIIYASVCLCGCWECQLSEWCFIIIRGVFL